MDKENYLSTLLTLLDTQLCAMITSLQDENAEPILKLLTKRPGFRDTLRDNDEESPEDLLSDLRESILDTFEVIASTRPSSGFDRIRDVFRLSGTEILMFLGSLAVSVDPRYEHIYAYLQNGKIHPTADTLLRLAFPDGPDRLASLPLLQEDEKLLRHCLLERIPNEQGSELSVCYRTAPGIVEAVSGTHRSDLFQGRCEWVDEPQIRHKELVAPYIPDADPDDLLMISWYGPDLQMHRYAAEMYAVLHGKKLMILDIRGMESSGDELRLVRYAMRDAAIHNALLLLRGFDEKIDSAAVLDGRIGNLIGESRTTVLFSSKRSFIFSPEVYRAERLLLDIPMPGLTGVQRRALWTEELSDTSVPAEDIREVSGQFVLTGAQIQSAAQTARAQALRFGREIALPDLYTGARASAMHHLSDLAKKMPPKYTSADLILPELQKKQMDELIAMAKNRPLVLEEWGLGKKLTSGYGISALFTGPPGTGKTLSAQVIAGELQLDMYRIDLSNVVSKYIGETEKNLEKIFTEAQNSNVILFFDEADSLFGKRSDVGDSHDRYANIEVGYLLQRMENYDGLVILATNLGANLDEAFTRRIHFIIDFPFPDEETRLILWRQLIPDKVEKADDIDLPALAAAYRIAGGNIRNAVVSAVYTCAEEKHPLCQADLIHGIEREYQKMGRVFK